MIKLLNICVTNRAWLLALVMMAAVAVPAVAQETWEKEGEGEIKDLEIELTKERQLTLPRANRYFDKVPPRAFEPIVPAITYEVKNFSYASPNYVPVIRPLRIKQEDLPKLYGNYVSAGIGNLSSFMVDGSVATKRDKKKLLGADFFWRSFGKGPVDGDNSAQSDTRFSLFGKTATDGAILGGDINYNNQRGYFYGYAPGTDPDRDKIKQVYQTLSAHFSMENRKRGTINYRLRAGYSQLDDAYVSSEREFAVNLNGEYLNTNQSKVLVDVNAAFIGRKDSLYNHSRNLIRVQTAYRFVPVEKLTLTLGVNIALTNESGQGTGASVPTFNLYPHLVVTYAMSEKTSLYGRFSGNMDKVNLHTLSAENFWLNSNNSMFHTHRPFELDGGVQASTGKFQGRAGISFARLDRLYFYQSVRNAVDPSGNPVGFAFDKFDLTYDNAGRMNPYLEGTFTQADQFTATLRMDYFRYSTDTLAEAWHRPTFAGDLKVEYNLFSKIYLQAGLRVQGGMKAMGPGTGLVQSLESAVDVNFRARYFFSKELSAFLQLNNLAASQYPLYLNYPARGFQAMVGVSWSF